jgi:aldehyde reductase
VFYFPLTLTPPLIYPPLPSPPTPPPYSALHDETILAIAAKHKKEPAQILIRWQLQRGVVVIPKSITPARIASNFQVFDFKLDEEDNAKIAALDRGHRLIKGHPWLREGETWEQLWDLDFLA